MGESERKLLVEQGLTPFDVQMLTLLMKNGGVHTHYPERGDQSKRELVDRCIAFGVERHLWTYAPISVGRHELRLTDHGRQCAAALDLMQQKPVMQVIQT